jgi:hypothetical protein
MGKSIRALSIVIILAALSGCVFSIGSSGPTNPTKGQQLIDLKAALDRGAINQQEYDQQKQQIMSSRP